MPGGNLNLSLKAVAEKLLLPKESFSQLESVLDKSRACFRRWQNSPAAQTVVIADLTLHQDLLDKALSMAAQMDIFGQ